MAFIQKNQAALASKLSSDMPLESIAITSPVELDDDIKISFNEAGHHQPTQAIILQMQMIRLLRELKETLGKQLIPTPDTVPKEIETDEE